MALPLQSQDQCMGVDLKKTPEAKTTLPAVKEEEKITLPEKPADAKKAADEAAPGLAAVEAKKAPFVITLQEKQAVDTWRRELEDRRLAYDPNALRMLGHRVPQLNKDGLMQNMHGQPVEDNNPSAVKTPLTAFQEDLQTTVGSGAYFRSSMIGDLIHYGYPNANNDPNARSFNDSISKLKSDFNNRKMSPQEYKRKIDERATQFYDYLDKKAIRDFGRSLHEISTIAAQRRPEIFLSPNEIDDMGAAVRNDDKANPKLVDRLTNEKYRKLQWEYPAPPSTALENPPPFVITALIEERAGNLYVDKNPKKEPKFINTDPAKNGATPAASTASGIITTTETGAALKPELQRITLEKSPWIEKFIPLPADRTADIASISRGIEEALRSRDIEAGRRFLFALANPRSAEEMTMIKNGYHEFRNKQSTLEQELDKANLGIGDEVKAMLKRRYSGSGFDPVATGRDILSDAKWVDGNFVNTIPGGARTNFSLLNLRPEQDKQVAKAVQSESKTAENQEPSFVKIVEERTNFPRDTEVKVSMLDRGLHHHVYHTDPKAAGDTLAAAAQNSDYGYYTALSVLEADNYDPKDMKTVLDTAEGQIGALGGVFANKFGGPQKERLLAAYDKMKAAMATAKLKTDLDSTQGK